MIRSVFDEEFFLKALKDGKQYRQCDKPIDDYMP
jgi:hypothetical protein